MGKIIYNPNRNIKIQPYEFNLNCGLKIEIDNPNIDFNDFDENSIEPYKHHVLTYFCKGNVDYYEYFDNWLCNIFQHPD